MGNQALLLLALRDWKTKRGVKKHGGGDLAPSSWVLWNVGAAKKGAWSVPSC